MEVMTGGPGDNGGDAGAGAIAISSSTNTLLMRTEAEQMEINQKRIEAELYQLRILAGMQSQKQILPILWETK